MPFSSEANLNSKQESQKLKSDVEHVAAIELPGPGDHVFLKKIEIKSGETSKVSEGGMLSGVLEDEIRVGKPIYLDSGANTSSVINVETKNESVFITTNTSTYEIKRAFTGLNMETDNGSVSLPEGAKNPQLDSGSAKPLRGKRPDGSIVEVKINRDELQNILIQVGEGVLHRFGDRYFVVAKVGKAHLPFYASSKGTSGKNKGDWYPFFGMTGNWVIKGAVDTDGSMKYSPKISEVQDLLNEHLILPDPTIVRPDDFTLRRKNGDIAYSIGDQIPVDSFRNSKEFKNRVDSIEDAEREYVTRVTGYDASELEDYHPSFDDPEKDRMSKEWISSITSAIEGESF